MCFAHGALNGRVSAQADTRRNAPQQRNSFRCTTPTIFQKPPPENITLLQRLLDQLNSRDPIILAEALREARALPPDDLLRLILLSRKARKVRREKRFGLHVIVMSFVAFCLFGMRSHSHFTYVVLCNVIFMMCNMCVDVLYHTYQRARRKINEILQEVDDIRFIPHLLRSIGGPSDEGLREALRRMLPQVRADHAPLWSKADKATLLIQFKKPTHDVRLTLCCLKALEQIGDKSAIPAVKKLMEQAFLNGWKTLWKASKECLLYLESNSGKFQQAETLLRASDAAHVRPDVLLRAASSTAEAGTGEQLLRPGVSENAP